VSERLAVLEGLVAQCQQEGLEATCSVVVGSSSEQILAEAKRMGADLIVRYAKGQLSLSNGKLGATAQRLLRQAPCAIFLHRPQAEPIQRIVAAVDATPQDEEHAILNNQILDVGMRLAKSNSAELKLVYAWTLYGDHLLKNHMPASQYEALAEHLRKQHVEGFQELLSAKHVPAGAGVLLVGDPSQAIPEYCEEHQAQLLICGTFARRGIPGLLLGNTIERIMQQVNCSILALPPEEIVSLEETPST
jgi:universal stress protein E